MSNQPNAWGINKVVKDEENKDEYKPDERIKRIYEAQREYARQVRQKKFRQWLNEYTDQNIKINEVLCNLCKDIEKTVNESGFTISNEKRLRDEVASFIYKESSNYA